jgi:hypothetical protein
MVAHTDVNSLNLQMGSSRAAQAGGERDLSKTLPLLLMVVMLVLSPFLFDIMQWVQSLLGGV